MIIKLINFLKIISIMRINQWIKNLLIFFPPIAAKSYEKILTIEGLLYFISFSLMASAVYCINDIADVLYDSKDRYKKNRPITTGILTTRSAYKVFLILFIGSLLIQIYLKNYNVLLILLMYFFFTTTYTFVIKKIIFLDILFLASFYLFRILYGSLAFNTIISPWLLYFSFFFFLGLSTIKRIANYNKRSIYFGKHKKSLIAISIACLLLSMVVSSAYLFSQNAYSIYSNPKVLFGSIFFLSIWNLKLIFDSVKKKIHRDPIEYCLRSKSNWLLIFIIFLFYSLSL